MDFMFDWEADGDRFSFDDSDRFEEDSLCSWISEPESLCNNWRGWRKQNGGPPGSTSTGRHGPVPSLVELGSQAVAYHIPFEVPFLDHPPDGRVVQKVSIHSCPVPSLVELGSQAVAYHIPFEVVEHFYPPIPEQLQLRIAFWSFAENEEDIRLYSCLSNGSADEFNKGDHLYKARAVREALQIGFHLSATVVPPQSLSQAKSAFNVAVMFDRRCITSCICTCGNNSWCAHVVALCLFRIHQANQVCLRAPVSESLNRLHRDQLQKFAQYLISELPQQILPTAQRLLDELLSSQHAAINTVCGAPDPTAGASASEQTSWCLDEATLHDNIKKTLIKFCVPSPIVFSDVNYLSSTAPPAAAEWQSLLRPLRGREPEGMWNLLSIVREMFRRNDSNAILLLEILTEEVLTCEQILVWWFNTKISASHNSANSHGNRGNQNSSSSSQHAASSMCDEIVTLWRLAALNPSLSNIQRDDLCTQHKDWHIKTIDKVRKARGNVAGGNSTIKKSDIEVFSGFKAGIEGTQLDWKDYPIPGLTHMEWDWPRWKFSFGKGLEECRRSGRGKCHTMSAVSGNTANHNGVQKLGLEAALAHAQAHHHAHNTAHAHKHHLPMRPSQDSNTSDLDPGSAAQTDGACSSSSEGFCENDKDEAHVDSDSDLGDADLPHHHHKLCLGASGSGTKGKRLIPQGPTTVAPPDGGACMAVAGPSTSSGAMSCNAMSAHATKHHDDQDSDGSLPGPTACYDTAASASPAEAAAQASGSAAAATAAALPKGEQSESQQSSDEYQVYFYDPKAKVADTAAEKEKKKKSDEPNYFAGIRKLENKQEILFARAEGLHAHGHTREACLLAKQLAEEMLNNPPDLSQETPPTTGKGKKKKAQNNISSFASTTLAKAAFLCSVLLEDSECHHLAFKVGMFGLEMPRPPASSKALEVKLAHQESELAALLKRIPLGPEELNVIRDRAEQLRSGKLKSRGEALLPLTLASFIFDSLCLPVCNQNGSSNRAPTRSPPAAMRSSTDEKLGFEAAVAALGLKANVSEADHALLCEGTRRQRGDLAIAMLVYYKDDQMKLGKIMDKLLDKAVHQLYKAPSLTTYLSASQTASAKAAAAAAAAAAAVASTSRQSSHSKQTPLAHPSTSPSPATAHAPHKSGESSRVSFGFEEADDDRDEAAHVSQAMATVTTIAGDTHVSSAAVESSPTWQGPEGEENVEEDDGHSLDYLNLEQNLSAMKLEGGGSGARTTGSSCKGGSGGARPKMRLLTTYNSKDTDSSAVEEDNSHRNDYKSWEAKFRCTNLKTVKKHSVGMAAVDSSAPETTSSDNSPTLVRRNWAKHQGPGSDSGSSGKSSDSLGSSSSGDKGAAAKCRDNESPPCMYGGARFAPHLIVDSRSSTPNVKGARYKGKNRIMPTVPNMPSEASAHFMFELAKTLLNKAGGTSSTSLFTQPAANTTHNGPHRNLHLCAFQVGLYALGLHNCVSPNWLSRTYSSHVSWITGQAMEIGSAAINILIDTWEGHLTPPEVASLADRASRGRDPNMVRAAAELALSCLPHAHALNPNEIQRALIQCKEQSREMLERACLAVESAAKGGGVYPEVLFDVAKRWYELYEEAMLGHTAPSSAAMAAVVTQAQVTQALVPVNMAPAQQIVVENNNSPPMMQLVPCQQMAPAAGPAAVAVSVAQPQQVAAAPVQVAVPQLQYNLPPPPGHHPQMAHQYMAPYSYVQQIAPNFGHHYSQPHMPLQTHSIHPSYLATYPYQNQTAFSNVQHLQNMHANAATLYHASHMRPPTAVQVAYTTQASPLMQNRPQHAAHMQNKFNQVQLDTVAVPTTQVLVITTQSNINAAGQAQQQQQLQPQPPPQQQAESLPAQNSAQMNYLLSAYRVGMLAMETLARRVHDDRPQTKYARNPPYGEDVKWLLSIAMKLGTTHLQQFCASAVNAVVSPFVLQDIAIESAHYLARNNPAQVTNQLRSPALNSVVQKCLQMFIQCTHQRMHHITQAEYEEFVGIVCSARAAFYLTPGGMVQFNELLQSLRRSKSCKKDLWQRIVNALATGNI